MAIRSQKMKALKYLAFFLLTSFLIFPIFQCNGQSSGLTITSKPYQWTDDMNRLGITTPEIGLVFEITIWNNSTQPLQSPYYSNNLWILILVIETDTQTPLYFRQEIDINNLYLPPNESDVRFVKVDNGGSLQIDSYTAELTWGWSTLPYGATGQGTPIEPYPFDFKVMSEQGLQDAIKQNPKPSGPTINIYVPVTVTVVGTGGLTLVILEILMRRRRRRR